MNIALIGYGKMGKIIETVAVSRGHQIVMKIDLENINAFTKENFSDVDVAIEFTGPHTALENVLKCISFHTPVVCGSTGWLDKIEEVENCCTAENGSFIYASNFSVGVNIFFEVNKRLAQLMEGQTQYDISIKEIHHTQKKDAPSGTAISLAEQVMANNSLKKTWVNQKSNLANELFIESERTDPYPGLHEVKYSSEIDDIIITHNAHNRNGFALGAVLAAEYIKDKKGIFTMKDVLGFGD
jgi:4-hydroxy-tetrahydrodipicolinate reductase